MIKQGFSFEFEVPDDWVQFIQNTQTVLQGPSNEEIIIAGWTVRGEAPYLEVATLRETLFQNAVDSINSVLSQPNVITLAPLQKVDGSEDLERWRIEAKTNDDTTLFFASILISRKGVLLITFESPNDPSLLSSYNRLIASIRSLDSQ